MKKKKIHFIFIILSLLLIIGSVNLNIDTTSYAKDRIVTEINNTPIIIEETNIEETIEGEETTVKEDESNSYELIELSLIIITSIITVTCILNLLFTKLGTSSLKESLSTPKRLIYYSIFLVIFGVSASIHSILVTDNKVLNGSDTKTRDNKSVAIYEVTKNEKHNSLKEESTLLDTSVIQVSNNATYKGTNLEIFKLSGSTTDKESSIYYGLNSALIVKDDSKSEIKDSNITTYAEYSSAIFTTGTSSTTTLNNVSLNTTNNHSNGLVVTDSATIEASNVDVVTKGDNSSSVNALTTGTSITIKDSNLNTMGTHSPLLYSSGRIEATNISGTTEKSNIATIKGTNSISIFNSDLKAMLNGEDSLSAITIYDENSKNQSGNFNTASLTIEESKITIDKNSNIYKKAPLFYITNIKATINIADTNIKYGSNILFYVTGNDKYGDIGDNGGEVTFTATDQTLKGNVIVDETSSIVLNLNNTFYKGQVNKDNLSKKVDIVLDKTAKWELTGDSYINTLTIQNGKISRLRSQIESNGYDIYYNTYQNSWLGGETIKLPGGGKLIPVYES